MLVQKIIPHPAVEALDEPVLWRFSNGDAVPIHLSILVPVARS